MFFVHLLDKSETAIATGEVNLYRELGALVAAVQKIEELLYVRQEHYDAMHSPEKAVYPLRYSPGQVE